MTYLVTGTAGFIGYNTARALLSRGDAVVGLDNLNDYYAPSLKMDRLQQLKPFSNFHFFQGDITEYGLLEKLFKNYRFKKICHLAAQAGVRYSLENPYSYQKSNIEGFLNILELCRHFDIKNLVYASSSSVYGKNSKPPFNIDDRTDHPVSFYAASKKANELMAYTYHHLYGLKCSGLRFFTVYGPWGRPDMAYYKFTKAIIEGKTIDLYNNGNMKRDFTFIDDIVAGILAALDKNYDFEIFNLGCSSPVDLKYLVECLEKGLGVKAKIEYLPLQPGELETTYADIDYSTAKLGFIPYTSIET
ncbi:MAG: NAD-dependent epimerase/dehydratase family protein, partial [Syntrophomonadaceae bacterium]|nr:NAD-dependent epimerase/dehydratase family protein [Syntrophomonadaceae bacterium]